MAIQAGITIGRTKNRRRYETVAKSVRGPKVKGLKKVAILRGQGKVPTFQTENITESMHILLRRAWRIEVEVWALEVIKRVAKDTRMTAGTLIPIGEELGSPASGFIDSAIRGGKDKRGHFEKPSGQGPPSYNKFGTRNKETGARLSRSSVKVRTGSAFRPVFSFTWDYGAWQHVLMDLGAPGTAWAGSPLRTVASASADFLENIAAEWAQQGLDFARFWVIAGDENAQELLDRKTRGRTLSTIGDQIIGKG